MNLLGKSVDVGLSIVLDVQGDIFNERAEVHGVDQAGGYVRAVRGVVRCVCAPPPHGGQIIPLAAANLRVEHAQKCCLEVIVGRTIKGGFVFIHHPVQVTPDFAPVQVFWALFFRQVTNGFYNPERDGYVRIVFISEVMGIYLLRLSSAQQEGNVLHWVFVGAVFHGRAGVIE